MKLAANLFTGPLVLLAAQTASAQSSYPNRPLKILVGFTPGTAPDLAARILADRFSEVWGTPFVAFSKGTDTAHFNSSCLIRLSNSSNEIAPLILSALMKKVGVALTCSTLWAKFSSADSLSNRA